MLFIFGVYISVMCFKKILCGLQDNESPLHPSERRGILSGRSSVKQHPSERRELSVRTPICVQKLRTVPSYIHSDVSATCPNTFQCSTSKRISFPNTYMGRQLQPSGRRSHSVWMLSLIRQDVQISCNRLDASLHCQDLWKLRAAGVQPSGR
jgi:hypothetical protein